MTTPAIQSVAVVGAGTMGAGIAQLAACGGCGVHLIDVAPDVLASAVADIRKQLDRAVEKGRMTPDVRDAALARIHATPKIEGLSGVQLAIEAVVEKLDIKRRVFAALEAACAPGVILATNTSSLSVTKIAEGVADPSRVIGLHFFNPAPVMPLVEVISAQRSDRACVDAAFGLMTRWGKTPVKARDTPGFIVNRVARGYYLEGLRLLGEGAAGVDEIDAVMRTHGRFRMGPFELMDLIGLDVNLEVSTSVWEQMGRPARLAPHDIQRSLVAKGNLGRKTGRGFYDYGAPHPVPAFVVDRRSFALNPLLSEAIFAFCARAGAVQVTSTEQYVFARILAAVINEAGFAYDEGVASSGDIDVAMEKGTNYPKGPLAWADEIGPHTVAGVLKSLNAATGDGRYAAAELFRVSG